MSKNILLVISLSLLFSIAALGQEASNGLSNTPSTTASTTKRPPVFRATKDQIVQVQLKLKQMKLYSGEATGKFNDPMRDAIKSFQKDNGLKQTGTLNRATLEKFDIELTASQKLIPISANSYASASENTAKKTTPAKSKTVIFRATADQIKAAQRTLKQKAMYAGEETGKLNDDTRAGLKRFQSDNGLKVTGTLNAVTLEKMSIPLTDKQKADAAATARTDN